MEAILNSSFDWNGIRAPYVFATENDSLNGASMLLRPPADQHAPRSSPTCAPTGARRRSSASPATTSRAARPGGIIHLINSGAATLDATGADGARRPAGDEAVLGDQPRPRSSARLAATTWYPADDRVLPRRRLLLAASCSRGGMPVTMSRHQPGRRAWARCCSSPRAGRSTCRRRYTTRSTSAPTRPGRRTGSCPNVTGSGRVPRRLHVMANWGANHGAISYGHIGADLITLASMLRIPVSHAQRAGRAASSGPAPGARFGTADPEGADYRACANFGPLYGAY